ncbi:hypothetical protein GCM10025862_09660 [Arsenicicoccus piscis]|uniref:Mur ligase central domain-containing protein n=1 Tax=Arsenicicoccus piscis TaxID=673954 RepID=A0ABQ6HMW0_9MICO|nr:hypothetical protein GCM10025862_09660 [Arsenicicoccus piscis]
MSDRPLDDAARGDAPRADAYEPRPGLTHRDADWAGLNVLVAGLGVSGFAAAVALAERDAHVIAVDASDEPSAEATDRDRVLAILEADVRRGAAHTLALPDDRPVDLVVTSPGWRPDQPLLAEAAARGIPVWGEVELAWRMRAETGAAPWLTVTGTNGKTTTVTMLASILQASGLRAAAVGNVGTPIIEAVLDPAGFDVLAVELSSFQLHWSRSISPVASVCLNVAPDHLDWHGSELEYHRAKGKVYDNTQVACLYNVEDPTTELMVMEADVVEGCRAVGFTLGVPAVSMLGVVDEVLADRAFIAQRHDSAAELGTLADLRGDALGGAALRRQRAGRRRPRPGVRGRPARRARGVAGLSPREAPHRRGRDDLGGALRRRLQGDQRARRSRLAAGLRPGGVDRRRPAQGRRRG